MYAAATEVSATVAAWQSRRTAQLSVLERAKSNAQALKKQCKRREYAERPVTVIEGPLDKISPLVELRSNAVDNLDQD